jgi:hypothetical protein
VLVNEFEAFLETIQTTKEATEHTAVEAILKQIDY